MFPTLKVTVNLKEVLARLDRLRNLDRIRPLTRASAAALLALYRRYTPVSKDPNQPAPGGLRAGWGSAESADVSATHLSFRIFNTDPRAAKVWPILLRGSKVHPIAAVRAKALSFRFANGDVFVGPRVMHPGTKKVVDAPALNKEVQAVVAKLRQNIADALASDKPLPGV